ncbi:MAG: catalase family peroxidase [Alphaproteobacteria bacterium]|nr:catalase family peroxidase [Alphaproteobacteria bacterium]MBU0794816.1 catalase family peroxidase [Alphaproteobacteria bacterium]MBU0876201.1 catalase family peroxidase [Alphaproteobacteria bacterium]MBU1768722.1 catalase family peroxidase [Alphaproteobacteria bacterium]
MSSDRRVPIGPFALIGAIILLLLAAFAWAAGWIGRQRINGGDVIAALDYNGGKHAGYRRAHAKGLCFSGTFAANGAGAALSVAQAFARGSYPVIGRFSIAGGNPLAGDGRNVFHSMALLLNTPDGQQWRMAMDHTPIFPVADVASFVALQRATRPDAETGKPDPAVMEPFLAAHPEVKAFQDYMAKAVLPDSFANATYYSINAFGFTDRTGTARLVRWQFVPEATLTGLDKASLDQLPRDYLFREMIARTAKGSSRWRLQLVVANVGDVTDKATVAWTGPHRTIDAGTLTIRAVSPEEAGACRDLNFDPTILPVGIGLSDDPLLAARSKSYSSSFSRRAAEGAGPSAAGEHLRVETAR